MDHYVLIRRFPDGHEEVGDYTAGATAINVGQTIGGGWKITEPPHEVEGQPLPVIVVERRRADTDSL